MYVCKQKGLYLFEIEILISKKYLHMSSVQQQPTNFPPTIPNPPTTEKISYLRENAINLALLAAFVLEDAFKINEAERQTYGKFAYAIKRLKQNSVIWSIFHCPSLHLLA